MPAKILVTDDDQNTARSVQIGLETEGYEVITANSGAEALQRVAEEKPDLIVLDVVMPVMNGFEVLQRLKDDPATAHIPVIMLTAGEQHDAIPEGQEAGAALFFEKPFQPRVFAAFIKRILDSRSSGST